MDWIGGIMVEPLCIDLERAITSKSVAREFNQFPPR